MRVLVVDDSAVARLSVRRELERQGAQVVEAASRAEGVACASDAFDAAVLDLELGDGTGVDVFDALSPGVRAAFLTSADEGELLDAAKGRARVFTKPAGLREAIAHVLKL